MSRHHRHLGLAVFAAVLFCAPGQAGSSAFSTASNYNTPYGMSAGEENAAINPSLRDSSGNLTMVGGQVTTANFGLGSSGVQSMSTISSSTLATAYGTGSTTSTTSSYSSTGAGASTATAIGNSLNVVTVGSNNTVIVNSVQTNNGDQTATVTNE